MYKRKHMEPIILTEYGDTLLEYPMTSETTSIKADAEKDPDASRLDTCIGVHDICNGWVDIRDISRTHKRITCRACKFTLTIPKSVETYGQLRAHQTQKGIE